MKVLVTGATGFVGGWLVRRLVERGVSVRAYRRSAEPIQEFQQLKVEEQLGPLTDVEALTQAMKGCHSVFHLAGLVGYSKSMHRAMREANVKGTAAVVEACQRANVERLLHFSSVVAIGASFNPEVILDETSPYNLSHLNLGYFETKHQAEQLVLQAVTQKKLNAVIVNPSTIYGAGDSRKGSRSVQLKVARGKFPFYTSGGVNVVHIEDVIEGTLSAWERAPSGERYILAGENILIRELFERIARFAGVKKPSLYLPNFLVHSLGRTGNGLEQFGLKGPLNSETAWTSTLYHWFSSQKAQSQLGFKPRPADEALRESIEWSQRHGLIS